MQQGMRVGGRTATDAAGPPALHGPPFGAAAGEGPLEEEELQGAGEHEEGRQQQQAQPAGSKRRKLGALQSVPVVSTPKEHLASAIKRAARVAPTAGIKSEAERERNKAAKQMDTLMKELSVPLTRHLSAFPDCARLHPFERALLQLTVGEANYAAVLAKVDTLRKSLQETGKSYASRASRAPNKAGAVQAATEGLEHLASLYSAGSRSVDALREVARKLRSLPLVDVELPTIALVGAPNVGKSSLVKLLSTGTPEVCNYPFTTRSIKMGHFYIDDRKHQVTDTPGLLNRPDDERNKMELLTLAVLRFLPTSILFVVDLTEECGTSVADQWAIRCEVASRFPDKPWVDVFSKADMVGGILQDGRELRLLGQGQGQERGQGGRTGSSSSRGESEGAGARRGTEAAGASVPATAAAATLVAGRAAPLDTSSSSGSLPREGSLQTSGSSSEEWEEGVGSVAAASADAGIGPEEVVARLPHALAVSSLTEAGVAELKAHIMATLLVHHQQQQQGEGWGEEEEQEEEQHQQEGAVDAFRSE